MIRSKGNLSPKELQILLKDIVRKAMDYSENLVLKDMEGYEYLQGEDKRDLEVLNMYLAVFCEDLTIEKVEVEAYEQA